MARSDSGKIYVGTRGLGRVYEITDNGKERTSRIVVDKLNQPAVAFHKGSDYVVRILEAARKQGKYWQTLETLLASQDRWAPHHAVREEWVWPSLGGVGLDVERIRNDMNAAEISRRIEQDLGDARALGVTKTPEFFVNGRPMPSFGLEELQGLVAEELRAAYP